MELLVQALLAPDGCSVPVQLILQAIGCVYISAFVIGSLGIVIEDLLRHYSRSREGQLEDIAYVLDWTM